MSSAPQSNPLIKLQNVSKYYATPSGPFIALNEIDLEIQRGEFVAVVGKSGSGKSTLMNLVTGIDTPTCGAIQVGDTAIHLIKQSALSAWRGKNIGVVFQFFQLLPTLTVLENVMLPMDFCNIYKRAERKTIAMAILKNLGIAGQSHKLPASLSGGQQQRAAIARALANDPPILIADEPTGNLDSDTAQHIMQLFADQVAKGKTVMLVTHERDYSHYFTRTITLVDGELEPKIFAQHRAFASAVVNHG